MRQSALMALARYKTSLPTAVSFMMMLVDMITSSAVPANSFKIRYTICRNEGSLFWKSLEMPKKRVVASFVGNCSPVNMRTAILVSNVRHVRGEIGEELKRRAARIVWSVCGKRMEAPGGKQLHTILEYGGPIKLDHDLVRIFIFLHIAHLARELESTSRE